MTLKELLKLGGLHDIVAPPTPVIERFHHSGHHHYHHHHNHGHGHGHGHGWHGHKSKSSGGGHSSAAISALTLLAFLFLVNVMQQSLNENNSTQTTTSSTIFLRDGQPISLGSSRTDEAKKETETTETPAYSEFDKPYKEMFGTNTEDYPFY